MSNATPIPNEEVLDGISAFPPALTGDLLSGVLVAWCQGGQLFLASEQDTPPFNPVLVNENWNSQAAPAVAIADKWARVYLSWANPKGDIYPGSSVDGFIEQIPISRSGSDGDGPALAFSDDILFIAWRKNLMLCWATCDFNGIITVHDQSDEQVMCSRPSLSWSNGALFALSGGGDESADNSMRAWCSRDNGGSFAPIQLPSYATLGPPSLGIFDDRYYLAWADASEAQLNTAVTQDLSQFTATTFDNGCHDGGPALLAFPDRLVIGWSYGAPPKDPRSHHVTIGELPVAAVVNLELERARLEARRGVGAPQPKCDPLSIWDPAEAKCVPKYGCAGNCVVSSFNSIGGYLVFNPIRYALCMIACKPTRANPPVA